MIILYGIKPINVILNINMTNAKSEEEINDKVFIESLWGAQYAEFSWL